MKHARINFQGQDLAVTIDNDGNFVTEDGVTITNGQVSWLPPEHGIVVCLALNYKSHVAQIESRFHEAPHKAPPKTPVMFIKTENTLTGNGRPVQLPSTANCLQPGPSLALVIGKTCCRIKVDEAFDYISGYTILNDFSLPEESYYRPPVRDKGYDSFGPIGPFIVDAADVSNPEALAVRTYVNGELRQEGNTSDLVWTIPEALAFISRVMTLQPGAIIATGFPANRVNVGIGDEVVAEVDGVGRLVNRVVSESDYFAATEQG